MAPYFFYGQADIAKSSRDTETKKNKRAPGCRIKNLAIEVNPDGQPYENRQGD